MIGKFPTPYIIFYPTISDDGSRFPINEFVQSVRGGQSNWRGNLVVLKYIDSKYSKLMHISMADYPILKNYFLTHDASSL